MKKLLISVMTSAALAFSCVASAAQFSASFKGVDINEFVNTVARNLNKTIIVAPRVQGKINVRSYDVLDEGSTTSSSSACLTSTATRSCPSTTASSRS